jgi:hypothetical protein
VTTGVRDPREAYSGHFVKCLECFIRANQSQCEEGLVLLRESVVRGCGL